jgi:hypothetical protein
MTKFQIKALPEEAFAAFFNLDDAALQQMGAVRMIADKQPGFPCRISLQDAAPGEEVLLLTYQHHKTASPYQSAGPVYIRKIAKTARPGINEIPLMLQHRLLSLRAYDQYGMMKNALVTEGNRLADNLHALFETAEISYIHIHNAKAGCYNCVVERV